MSGSPPIPDATDATGTSTLASSTGGAPDERPTDVRSFIGRIIGEKFRLDDCIGESRDSLVFRARQLNLQRDVAVKILLAEAGGEWQLGARLRREARLIAALRHAGIGEVYDEGVTEDGWPFIVMELLRGKTLRDYMTERGRLPASEAAMIVASVCDVLGFIHMAGYVHRDLKPSNIFLDFVPGQGVTVKVIDFGAVRRVEARLEDDPVARRTLSGLANPSVIRTMPGYVIGTPHYMSPEQCACVELDARSDIYSLGVLLHELLAGALPFSGATPTELMAAHLVVVATPLGKLGVHVPADLERVVLRALEKEPARRYQSMAEFGRAIRAVIRSSASDTEVIARPPGAPAAEDEAVQSARGEPRNDSSVPVPQERWPRAAIIGLGVLAMAVVVVLWLLMRAAHAPAATSPALH